MKGPLQALDVFRCPLQGTNLIEASAGTGKTWNICGLVLRLLIERGLTVQQVLVVTFTNAATAELRERIRDRLAQTLAALRQEAPTGDPFVDTLIATQLAAGRERPAMAACLDEALQTFDEASVFTIHGFCQRALADTPFAAGLPMQTELLADDSALRLQVAQDHWRRRVVGGPVSPALAAHLASRRDTPHAWAGLLKQRLGKPLSPLDWPAEIDAVAEPSPQALMQALSTALQVWRAERPRIIDLLEGLGDRLNKSAHAPASRQRCYGAWDALAQLQDDGSQASLSQSMALLLKSKDLHHVCWASLRFLARHPKPDTPPHPFFGLATAVVDARRALDAALPLLRLRLIRELLEEGPAALQALKREHRVVAFDDMLANLHARLADADAGAPLAHVLRERFPAALIDEFQDTDPLQFEIFRRIYLDLDSARERSPHQSGSTDAPAVFFVGDPKQAIYSFRNADLRTYLDAAQRAQRRYTLAENQRSVQPLIESLNALFAANPRAFVLEGLDYQRVGFGAKPRAVMSELSPPGSGTAPLQLWQLPPQDDGTPLRAGEAQRRALTATAAEIARLLAAGQRGEIRLGERPLQGSDVAVLVRTHAEGAQVREALAALGVASVELSQQSVFATSDAMELEQLLAAVLEPTNERLLRSALATTLLGFDALALEALAEDEPRLSSLIEAFGAWQAQWLKSGVGVMLRRLMHEQGVDERMLRRDDGERRLTNLRHLAELLHEAQRDGAQATPAALLRWLRDARQDALDPEHGGDEAAQLRLESDRHLVQIVTIHKSKGLEYAVVFCPFLWKARKAPSAAPGTDIATSGGRIISFDEERLERHRAQIVLDTVAEDLRLVYVALTRAVHRCHLVVGSYLTSNGPNGSDKAARRNPLNWLAAGEGHDPVRWFHDKEPALTVAQIDAAWQAWASRSAPHAALRPLPEQPGVPLPAFDMPAGALSALPTPTHLPKAWWVGSYSSLASGSTTEESARDRDALEDAVWHAPVGAGEAPAGPTAGEIPRDDDILDFPRGTEAGTCLHAVFEHIDFTAPPGWPAAVQSALRRHPLDLSASGLTEDRAQRMLLRMVADVLSTAIPTPGRPVRLDSVGTRQRRVEMEFNLPSPRLDTRALRRLMVVHGYPAPTLAVGELQGFLRGFIDLVFEHEGRFHILDWKSNHLGTQARDYARPALRKAMQAHGYHLQSLLYVAALHRYLTLALPGYDWERHMGGAAYLFVRGMRPGWMEPDGHPCGVFVDRPSRALVEQLLQLLTGTHEHPVPFGP